MELKYSDNSLHKVLGIIGIMQSIMGLILFLMCFKMLICPITIFISGLILAYQSFTITKRTYISISDEGIYKATSYITKNKFIRYADMKVGKIFGQDLRIELKDGKEIKINLRVLKLTDIELLTSKLSEHIEVL